MVRRRYPGLHRVLRTVDELDDVADDAHDQEADSDCLRDLDELALVWLGAAVDKLQAVLDELLRHAVAYR